MPHIETELALDAFPVPDDSAPVLSSAEYAFRKSDIVQINDVAVRKAARHIHDRMLFEHYTPRSWRDHPLHLVPPDSASSVDDPQSKLVLDWIFLISSLNFSFWSELEGKKERYGVEWRKAWGSRETTVHTGYWSLVAAVNRAMEDDQIPINDPSFFSSPSLCPDSVIERVFRPSAQSTENVPLLKERIKILREVGSILVSDYGGSFHGFIKHFHKIHNGQGTALDLVKLVTSTFPSFRDEVDFEGQKVYFWKRAQILVAETWAAFYPSSPSTAHPIFPGPKGACIQELTMFADYRVPQILHHLSLLTYPPSLTQILREHKPLEPGCKEEVSIRAASIVVVERVRREMLKLRLSETDENKGRGVRQGDDWISSVVIDFYLWDLAKKVELGEEGRQLVPIHRTRSIWY